MDGCRKGLSTFQDWLETLRHGRVRYLVNSAKVKAQWESKLSEHVKFRDELAAALDYFRQVQRYVVPFFFLILAVLTLQTLQDITFSIRTAQPSNPKKILMVIKRSRRINICSIAMYISTTSSNLRRSLSRWYVCLFINELESTDERHQLDEMIRLEKERQTLRLWTPIGRLIRWNNWEITEDVEGEADEDPGSFLVHYHSISHPIVDQIAYRVLLQRSWTTSACHDGAIQMPCRPGTSSSLL